MHIDQGCHDTGNLDVHFPDWKNTENLQKQKKKFLKIVFFYREIACNTE